MTTAPLISIAIDPVQLAEVDAALGDMPNAHNRAIARAINRMLPATRARLEKLVLGRLSVRRERLDTRIFTRQATAEDRFAQIRLYGRPFNLISFPLTIPKYGPMLAQIRGLKREPIWRGFVNNAKGGHKIAYKRTGVKRYPIKAARGPSVTSEIQQGNLGPELQAFVAQRLPKEVNDALEKALTRRSVKR